MEVIMRPTTGVVLIVLSLGIAESSRREGRGEPDPRIPVPATAADERSPARSRQTDPDRRMPAGALQARWLGQAGQDRTGPGPSVGPDGLQDARIHLGALDVKASLK